MKLVDLSGKRFGRLIVLKRFESNKTKLTMWQCICDCGVEIIRCGADLKALGDKCSCGCLKKENISKLKTKHSNAIKGKVTPEYRCWQNIRKRCSNEKDKEFHNYGGRGITVCDSWSESFENFIADMGTRPSDKHSLDRINVNGNYELSNCRWTTMTEQNRNRRLSKRNKLGVNGIEWMEHLKKWRVRITVNYKKIHVGVYSDLEEAVEMRKKAELQYWGKTS